jgi:ureidoglycolate lyase
VTTLRVEPLTPGSFEPFGEIIAAPSRSPDASGPGWQWWGETTLLTGDGRAWGIGHLALGAAELEFDWAERHMRTKEVVIATSGDLLVYVAPALHPDEPSRLPPLDDFRVFRVPAGVGVALAAGVWHGAPLAAGDRGAALVLLQEGTGREDVTMVRFADSPVTVMDEPSPRPNPRPKE